MELSIMGLYANLRRSGAILRCPVRPAKLTAAGPEPAPQASETV
jgi:hypothetical protein